MKPVSIAEREQFRICKTAKIFTPLQAHGMEKITAWRGRKFSLATQKNKAFITESTRSNKILQNKQNISVFIL